MNGSKFQIYFYDGATQVGTGNFLILKDSAFIDKYKQYTTRTKIQEYSGQTYSSLAKIVNGFFDAPIINNDQDLYTPMNTGAVIDPYFVTGFNTLNQHLTPVFVPDETHTIGFITIGGSLFQDVMGHIFNNSSDQIVFRGSQPLHTAYIDIRNNTFSINVRVNADDVFDAEGNISNLDCIDIEITGVLANTADALTSISIYVQYTQSGISNWTPAFNSKTAQEKDTDVENPFDDDDNDGGDGDNQPPEVNPTDVPPLPGTSAANAGLITLYIPTLAQLQALGSFLWSDTFDIDTYKKLFSDPIQAIIGLGIVPAIPSSGGAKNIHFGNVDSGVNSSFLSTQYVNVDCGTVAIKKDIGSFLDYVDTKISIYLPYIGFRELAPDDVMGYSLNVQYNIDVLTGACAAFIKNTTRGVMYAYNGSCITNVPLTGANYSGAIQNAVSTVASGVGVLAGMASGAAPVTLMSAASMLSSGANTLLNSKPTIQRSGNLGGSAGILSVQKPFIIIQRPNYSFPSNMSHYVGYVSNKSASLGSVSGFTMVEEVHIDGITATSEEIAEIETLLKRGVIL